MAESPYPNGEWQRTIEPSCGTLSSRSARVANFISRQGILFGRTSLVWRPFWTRQSHLFIANSCVQASYSRADTPIAGEISGLEVNEWRDEQPGKILHELRVGELAHLNEIPQTPYYGSVDSTPLFLILIARHSKWTGDISLFHELREPIQKAFEWISRSEDESGRGYLEYSSKSSHGLTNQGWKDSDDCIVNADGTSCQPPIALVEVQGYVYLAKTSMADLYEKTGDTKMAQRLRVEAEELRKRFERDFWLRIGTSMRSLFKRATNLRRRSPPIQANCYGQGSPTPLEPPRRRNS